MNEGIDLNAIPGERASKGSKVRHTPLVKKAKEQMLGNKYVEVKPIRHNQRYVNHYQKPRVHVPEYYNPPVPFDWYNEVEKNPPSKFYSFVFSIFLYATVIIVVGVLVLLAIDPLFWLISEVLSLLWSLVMFTFWIFAFICIIHIFLSE